MTQVIKPYGSGSGGKAGGGASRVAQEDPNTLQSNTIARTVHVISWGPCGGLHNSDKSIFLDDTALQASDDTYNFSGVSWEQRTGEPDQAYVAGYPSSATTVSVNTEVTKASSVTRTYTGPLDAVRVTVGLPYLAYQNTSNGDLLKTTVSFSLYKRENGTATWTKALDVTYNDKCVSTFNESFRIPLGGTSDWDIKFERNTDDSTESNLQNKTEWAFTTRLIDGKFQYPNCGLVAMTVDAKLFGSSIPSAVFDWDGLILQIPSNYDPETRSYTGIWDGTFTTGWSDNPAWVLYSLLVDRDFGLGQYISETKVDKYLLYSISQYCDEMVDDGFGGTEPRYTFNYQFNAHMSAFAMLQIVAASFAGVVYYNSGNISFMVDMPSDPVRMYTESNVKNGLFTYESTSLSSRHSVAMVTWNDPDDMCRSAVEMVVDHELLERFGWRETSVIAYGCTSRGQAHRVGRRILEIEKSESTTVNFEVGWDSCGVVPGDIVEVYDTSYQGEDVSGRIISWDSNSITLDREVVIDIAYSPYTLSFMAADGTLETRTITNPSSVTDLITFTEALTTEPIYGARWGISSAAVSGKPYRVIGIKRTAPGDYVITALEYDESKYARIDEGLVLDAKQYSIYNKDKPKAPTALEVSEYLYKYDFTLKSGITVTWTPSEVNKELVRGYEVQIQIANGDWRSLGETTGTTLSIKDVDTGEHNVRVRAISFVGIQGDWYTKNVTLFGVAAAPEDVSNFRIAVLGDTSTLSWDANTDLDISHYKIKYSPLTSGASWAASTLLVEKVSNTSIQVPTQPGTYLIKAVDYTNVESASPAVVVTTTGSITNMNAVAALSDWPSWSGTLSNLTLDGTSLELDAAGVGTYTFASYYDLGSVYVSRVSVAVDAYSGLTSGTWSSFGAWSTLGAWSSADTSNWNVKVQLRYTSDDPSGTPTWTDWMDLVVGDYEARAFEFKIVVENYTDGITTVVDDATITIDMPDRTYSEKGITSSTSGTSVTFDPEFRAIAGVNITMQNGATGDYFEYTSAPTTTGFTILFKNAAGSAISRDFDYTVVGYGRVS